MTTTTTADRPAREVPAGTLVIYTGQPGTFEYEGPSGGPYAQFDLGLGARRNHPGLTCDPHEVAPADTPIPVQDARVSVTRQELGRFPSHLGPWLLTVAGRPVGTFSRTKRDGLAAGLRTVAILDWHAAGTATATPDPI